MNEKYTKGIIIGSFVPRAIITLGCLPNRRKGEGLWFELASLYDGSCLPPAMVMQLGT
jgi:hypothetical protein